MEGRRLDVRQPSFSSPGRPAGKGRGMPLWVKCLFFAAMALLYVAIAAIVVYFVSRNGTYPSGSDTMFYVYRGDFLYRSITQEGNWYPLLDMQWYNGVQTWRYWSPVPAAVFSLCKGIMGGNLFDGYLLCVGFFCFLGALVWLIMGYTHRRPVMGAILGALWFFVPCNLFMFFSEGVLSRSMAMAILPWFLVSVYDYLYRPLQRRLSALVNIILSLTIIILFHVGWAAMMVISLLIFLLFYFVVNLKKEHRVPVGPILLCALLAFLITGIWLIPSLIGGITGIDTSAIMRDAFQSLNRTLNPFYGWLAGGSWNRWNNIAGSPYFGLAAFCLCVFGVLFARRQAAPGFATAAAICLLTSSAVYPLLSRLPGASYLWMLRFIALALTFVFVSLLFWPSLKRRYQAVILILLATECALAFGLFLGDGSATTPEERFAGSSKPPLIDVAQEVTAQRASLVEPGRSVFNAVYCLAGYGENPTATSYGQGLQAAANYSNVVQVNQAAEDGQFLYMFDRLFEMGNDTVIVPVSSLDPQYADLGELDAAAARVGYRVAASNEDYRLYHMDTPQTFGMVTKYRAIAIGSGSNAIALGFPAVQETEDYVLDHYTFEELSEYDVIYLAGFTYKNRETAEELVLKLSEAGSRVIIMADGIPSDEHTGSKTFLDVSCNTVNFQNGYPALDTIDGVLYCDLFPDGYATDWKTVYLNGLDDVWGTITDVPEGRMDFYGTAKNDNIILIGLALTYHYSLTQDPSVGMLLSHALTLSSTELPRREIVPISVDYHNNVITIDAPCDNVNTTLAFHDDIFDADRPLEEVNNMTVVGAGPTVIRLRYPYFAIALTISTVGVVFSVCYLALMNRRFKDLLVWARQQEEDERRRAEQLRRGAELEAELEAKRLAHQKEDEEIARQEAEAKTAKLQEDE